jgi:LacI family transcriptional regulator
MRDVAGLAGVSLKTVSRVVNREEGVSPALVERVASAVAMLGYRHNLAASSIRRSNRRTATIGLLLDNVANPFDSALHRAVEEVARAHGSLVLAGSSERDTAIEEEVLGAFASRGVDGLVVVPASSDHRSLLQEHRLGLPVVFADRPDASGQADSVVVDNVLGAGLAVRHLVAHGHRRIALLADRPEVWTAEQRVRGYREALLGAGLPVDPALVRTGLRGSEAARAAVHELLALPDPPTALFAAQNLLTVGAVQALRASGARLALVGFDDFPLADLLEPGMTVVAQDVGEIGRSAAELLFARIAGATTPPQVLTTQPTLVPRGSGEIPGPAAG